jgi:hypothetical protein
MPIIIRCHSCGFELYNGNELKSIDLVLREWGYRCPVCMSPLSRVPLRAKVEAIPRRNRYIDDDEIKDLIINTLKSGQFTTKELVSKVTKTLGIDEAPLKDRVKEIIRRLERDGVIIRASTTKGKKIIWALNST